MLVSELVLADDSGLHLLVEARRLHPHVARVAATAVEEFDAAVASINEAEVFRFLRKPVDAFALRTAVEEALARADAAHEAAGARSVAERRRNALLDLESDHPGDLRRAVGRRRLLHPAPPAGERGRAAPRHSRRAGARPRDRDPPRRALHLSARLPGLRLDDDLRTPRAGPPRRTPARPGASGKRVGDDRPSGPRGPPR